MSGPPFLFIDVDGNVAPLLRTTCFANEAGSVRAGTVQRFPLDAYFGVKNAALAGRIAAVWKDLKRENKAGAGHR
jgi:hypothetical protein